MSILFQSSHFPDCSDDLLDTLPAAAKHTNADGSAANTQNTSLCIHVGFLLTKLRLATIDILAFFKAEWSNTLHRDKGFA